MNITINKEYVKLTLDEVQAEFSKRFIDEHENQLYIDTSAGDEFLPSSAKLLYSNPEGTQFIVELEYHLHDSAVYKVLVDQDLNQISHQYESANIDKDKIISLIYDKKHNSFYGKNNPNNDHVPYTFKKVTDNGVEVIARGETPVKNFEILQKFMASESKIPYYYMNVDSIKDKELNKNFKTVIDSISSVRESKIAANPTQPNNN